MFRHFTFRNIYPYLYFSFDASMDCSDVCYSPRSLKELSLSTVSIRLPDVTALVSLPNPVKTALLNVVSKRDLLSDELLGVLLNVLVKRLEAAGSDGISDKGLSFLHLCPNLRKLDLNALKGTRGTLSTNGLLHVSIHCPYLMELLLRRCVRIDDEGIGYISHNCSLLTILNISSCVLLTDISLNHLSNLRALRNLDISRNDNFSDDGVIHFVCENRILTELSMNYCSKLSDDAIVAVAEYCPDLKMFSFAGCPLISSASRDVLSENPARFKLLTWTI